MIAAPAFKALFAEVASEGSGLCKDPVAKMEGYVSMSQPKVEIYTKWGCPYCVMAKSLLDDKGVPYEEYDITMGGPKRQEMLERVPGARTVPQVLVDGTPYGGFDDIDALNRAGKLDPVLGL
ncbi:MAG: glutaredoxin 3 [Novosphingobium lindaniclasticum]|jgi:glutaredoxin 3|nr:glutaredoxin 3 [Novosphingobium lindaniclasticum]